MISPARRLLHRIADAYGRYRSRRAAFLAHERTPIADARMGELVKVVGRLRGDGRELRSPVTATPCLWYRTAVKSAGKTLTEESSTDLFLDDESGSALVDARSARFSLVAMRSGWTADSSMGVYGAKAAPSGKKMYREVLLKEGDRVAVLGRPHLELDPTSRGDFRTPPTRIVFDEPGLVLVSDEPGVF